MFKNAGSKLKSLARIIFALNVIIGIVVGIVMIKASFVLLIVSVAVGVLIGWLSSIMLYAFGELCENVHEINKKLP